MSKTIIKAFSDAAGVSVGQPNQTVAAYDSTGQTGLTSGVAVKVQFDTEDYDVAGVYDNTTNYRFQPTVAGRYQINASVNIASSSLNSLRSARSVIYKNGSALKNGGYFLTTTATVVNTFQCSVNMVIELNGTTDYIEIYARGDTSSGTWLISGTELNTYFSAFRIFD